MGQFDTTPELQPKRAGELSEASKSSPDILAREKKDVNEAVGFAVLVTATMLMDLKQGTFVDVDKLKDRLEAVQRSLEAVEKYLGGES